MAQPKTELPVIDVSPLAHENGDAAAKARVAAAIRVACIEWGFFYVTGYGQQLQQQVDAMIEADKQLFDLSLTEKQRLAASLSPLHRGYTPMGGAHNCSQGGPGPDQKESFLLGAEGAASQMHGPNPWPAEQLLPGWAAAVAAYFAASLDLARVVARGLALALSLPERFFVDRMADPVAQLLLLRYPAAAGDAPEASASAARRRVGCGEHTDCGFLTILAQDAVPGLEVRTRASASAARAAAAAAASKAGAAATASCCSSVDDDAAVSIDGAGAWMAAPPIPGALLVNLGDLAEFWSGGVFRSTPHRVNIFQSEGAAARTARHSVVMFCNCDFDARVVPLRESGRSSSGGGGGGGAAGAAAADDDDATTAGRYIMEKLGLMYTA